MISVNGDIITFSSGRSAYANRGIVGINADLELHQGYDGSIDWPIPEWWKVSFPQWITPNTLAPEDMLELADYMVSLWLRFRETLPEGTKVP